MEFQCTTATLATRDSCALFPSCAWRPAALISRVGRGPPMLLLGAYGVRWYWGSLLQYYVSIRALQGEKDLQFYYARPSRGLRAAHGPPSLERYFWQKKRFT
jgi:hypothetical protein